tara:strand:+ start:23326 stop:23532 length:207 start_codon:yes stop_codon:yes gene_type:complete
MNFAFESLSAFFSMGGYSFYVWSAYGISFLFLLLLCIQSIRMQKNILYHLKKQMLREQKIKERTKVNL